MAESYTIGEIAAAHEENVRTVRFWVDSGVIRPVEGTGHGGKGSSRRFDESEMRFAGLAKRLAAMNSPVGEIGKVIDAIRSMEPWNLPADLQEEGRRIEQEASAALAGGQRPSRFATLNRLLALLSKASLCSAETEIELIISYYQEAGEVKSRIVFLPRTHDLNVYGVARMALHGFIGFKALTLSPERDIWVSLKLDTETMEIMQKAYSAALRMTNNIIGIYNDAAKKAEA
jgi:DNA-binding transcriptional MerR regulator